AIGRIESDDGLSVPVLSPSLMRGLPKAGLSLEAARAELLGRRTLEGAPHINPETLHSQGLSDYELAQVEEALPTARSLAEVFSPRYLDVHFIRDVWGLSESELDAPDLNLLARMGFDEAQIAQANAYVFGSHTPASPELQ